VSPVDHVGFADRRVNPPRSSKQLAQPLAEERQTAALEPPEGTAGIVTHSRRSDLHQPETSFRPITDAINVVKNTSCSEVKDSP